MVIDQTAKRQKLRQDEQRQMDMDRKSKQKPTLDCTLEEGLAGLAGRHSIVVP